MSASELHLAAYDGDNDAVNHLLDQGLDIHARTKFDVTPLLLAAMCGNTEVVRTLLRRGAAAHHFPKEGSSNLTPAMRNSHADLLDTAIQSGNTETVRVFLEHGYSPEAAESVMPISILDVARLRSRDLEMVRLLLEHGANPDGAATGARPIEMAVMKGDTEFVELLLNSGARTDAGEMGMDMISLAAMQGNPAMIVLFAGGSDDSSATLTEQAPKIALPDFAQMQETIDSAHEKRVREYRAVIEAEIKADKKDS